MPETYFIRVGTPCRPCPQCSRPVAELLTRAGSTVAVDKPSGDFEVAAVVVRKARKDKQDEFVTEQDTCQPCHKHKCKGI